MLAAGVLALQWLQHQDLVRALAPQVYVAVIALTHYRFMDEYAAQMPPCCAAPDSCPPGRDRPRAQLLSSSRRS